MKLFEYIKERIEFLTQDDFKTEVRDVYLYYFYDTIKPSKRIQKLLKKETFYGKIGEIIPLYSKKNKIAWYEVTSCYHNGSMSDLAFNDSGKSINLKLVKITN